MTEPEQPGTIEELILRPSRWGIWNRLTLLVAVTAFYIWFNIHYGDCWLLWLFAIAGGFLALGVLRQLLDRHTCLRLTPRGFAMVDRLGPVFFAWQEIKCFRLDHRGRLVVFDYADSSQRPSAARRTVRLLAGGDGLLPYTYGLKATELAHLLNEWRERYGATG